MPSSTEARRAQQQRRRRQQRGEIVNGSASAIERRSRQQSAQNAQRRQQVRRQPLRRNDSVNAGEQRRRRNQLTVGRRLHQDWWDTLPQERSERWHPPEWSTICPCCGARLLSTENSSLCCSNGTRRVPRLTPLPNEIRSLLENPSKARDISSSSRRLNNLFSFTAIGFTGQSRSIPPDAHVEISGRSYHRILHLDSGRHSMRWFLYDEAERTQAASQWAVDLDWVTAVRTALDRVNPYIHNLRAFASMQDREYLALELQGPSANGDFAVLAHIANSTSFQPRSIVIWKHRDAEPEFINLLSPHYEPMQYPVLFPHGELGWGLDSRGQRLRDMTQIEWYRRRILSEERFQIFGRLANEYLCDMWSRVQEEQLSYIFHNRTQQQQNRDTDPNNPSSLDVMLPADFLGSRAWTKEETADSLALARHFGRGTLMITMTTNPEWPEIVARLQPGQTAADVPIIVARVFRARLNHLLDLLRTKFGDVVYSIRVIEFQKRGFPHAHIIIKVS